MPSWTPADTYDPNAFYTEASDKKGRGEPINARIPPQIHGGIAALVQSGKIPAYQTQSDFVRDALVHHLHRMAERTNDEALRRRVSMVTLLNREIQAQQEKDDYAQLMMLIEDQIVDYRMRNQNEASSQYIKERLSEIDALPERFQEDYERRLSAKLYPI
jgi:Arc/MetJ-type ribon-helix-helix transcriptional regulator